MLLFESKVVIFLLSSSSDPVATNKQKTSIPNLSILNTYENNTSRICLNIRRLYIVVYIIVTFLVNRTVNCVFGYDYHCTVLAYINIKGPAASQ